MDNMIEKKESLNRNNKSLQVTEMKVEYYIRKRLRKRAVNKSLKE